MAGYLYCLILIIIFSIAPAADCTNDYTFHRTKYVDRERGYRHLDGFVDCEAALEGNQYYVEDNNLTDVNTGAFSCFTPYGLCFLLTSSKKKGGWEHYVFDISGNNKS